MNGTQAESGQMVPLHADLPGPHTNEGTALDASESAGRSTAGLASELLTAEAVRRGERIGGAATPSSTPRGRGEPRERLVDSAASGPGAELRLSEIDFGYGHVQVLFDVSFDVKPGETVALLGSNGAGKSSLLRVVAGLSEPWRGEVELDGRTLAHLRAERRGDLGLHMLPGGQGVFGSLSVEDNLELAAFRYRNDRGDRVERIERALGHFPDLKSRTRQRAGSLSGGQQQMLALAMVLLHDPRLLIIDELSLGLAPIVVGELLDVLAGLRETGLSMVIVEQSLNIALDIADRAVFLEKGRVLFDGAAAELAERGDLVQDAFLGRESA